MAKHLVAFHHATPTTAHYPLPPIPDDCLTTSGNDLTVPTLNQIVAHVCCGATPLTARLSSPSLRRVFLEEIIKIISTETFVGAKDYMVDLKENPLILDIAEKLNALLQATTDGRFLVWLSDAPIVPETGEIHTIKGTLAGTIVADLWQVVTLALSQTLPAGRYRIVGMSAYGGQLLAARLIVTGEAWRMGVPCSAAVTDADVPMFRKGRFGSFGEFEFDQPPKVEVISKTTAGAGVIALDLIQIRAGR